MAKVKVFYDRIANSLVVWFDEAKKEVICEEIGDDTVLRINKVESLVLRS